MWTLRKTMAPARKPEPDALISDRENHDDRTRSYQKIEHGLSG